MTCSGIILFRGASPLGLPYRLARGARSLWIESWDRHRAQKLLQDLVGVHVFRLGANGPRDPMPRRVAEDLLDVLRQRPRPAVQERGHTGQSQQVLVGARRDAEREQLAQIGTADASRIAGRTPETDDVFEDLRIDVDG